MAENQKKTRPKQTQSTRPGRESEMTPKPKAEIPHQKGTGKLAGKVAIITGADSGIGRAVAVAFAEEGAKVAVLYLNEHEDADETRRLIEEHEGECLLIAGDIGKESFCQRAVEKVVKQFGGVDILVNNASEQHPQDSIEDITEEQLERTFRTNVFGYFFMTKAALPHLKEGSSIINTASVTAFRGSPKLLDYSATKGAEVAFTRSLSLNLAKKKIRVNGVAPGPIWTPLIPSTFPGEKVESFGASVPMERAGEPAEVAPCFVFLASNDSSFMSGQFLHPNGGEIINT
ncbi:MAG TPA: SDR family oxidoreductase [Methylomirabilota bacterium]|nr:SDR family oxidoreductase [Methylomirabilota bacterium]